MAGVLGLYSPSPGVCICQDVSKQHTRERQRQAGRGQSRRCGACAKEKNAVTCHMEFPVHHCYGDIWPAVVDSCSVAARCIETGFPRGRNAGSGLSFSPWRSHTLRRRYPISPAGSWNRVRRKGLKWGRCSGGSLRRRLSLGLEHVGRAAGLSYGIVGSRSESLCVR